MQHIGALLEWLDEITCLAFILPSRKVMLDFQYCRIPPHARRNANHQRTALLDMLALIFQLHRSHPIQW